MFDWNKPFARKCDLDKDTVPRAELLCIVEKPFRGGETHVVRIGESLLSYHKNGEYYDNRPTDGDLVNLPEKKVVERWVVVSSEGITATHSQEWVAQQTANEWKRLAREVRIHHIREEF